METEISVFEDVPGVTVEGMTERNGLATATIDDGYVAPACMGEHADVETVVFGDVDSGVPNHARTE